MQHMKDTSIMLLSEFDEDGTAILEPSHSDASIPKAGLPETFLCPFAQQIIDELSAEGSITPIGAIHSVNGTLPIYSMHHEGREYGVVRANMGAPIVVGDFEELYYFGAKHFIVFGPCGILSADKRSDEIIIPVAALRDEGTSYHYAPPSASIAAQASSLALMKRALEEHSICYGTGVTWTTDAIYRETRKKTRERVNQGASVVDMEASALMAWSQFRHADVCQFFYTADYVSQDGWDRRMDQRRRPLEDFLQIALLIASHC
ncbi:MAG: nucleoside phosphorylase [Bifidobacterium sp.]|jgi:uridine phosphorylase|nr:nucleoside phosphorylase [Bifidobacterium sp.]MCH4174690.1 nucleoside phosphorylase [Bifidobacterium sp.]